MAGVQLLAVQSLADQMLPATHQRYGFKNNLKTAQAAQ